MYPLSNLPIIVQRIEDLYFYPSNIISSTKDEHGNYHNDNDPAIITPDNVYFITHGHDWLEPKYEKYIRQLAKTLYPKMETEKAPFEQLESIIMASQGWGQRKTLLPNSFNKPRLNFNWEDPLKEITF